MFRKIISCALSPNTELDDVLVAIKVLCMPWTWKHGGAVSIVERRFGGVTFNSGRSALLAILKAFTIGDGDEVIVQAFTCVAVPNSVIWTGAKPVFVDIDGSYNLSPSDVERKISKKTKAIVVQHTFGISANMDAILSIAKKHNIIVIEDFAHTMSLQMRGDAAFYSFGRDKVLSSVWGGAASIHSKFKIQSEKLRQLHSLVPMPSHFWIFQQLLHPIAFSIILKLYDVVIGKIFLVLLQKLHLLSIPVKKEEKTGRQPTDFPAKYPNALAVLLVNQLKKLDTYTEKREQAVRIYGGKSSLLRYPKYVDNPQKIITKAKSQGILLGNWYHTIIDPIGVRKDVIGYIRGSCPKAEDAAAHIINLPTLVSKSDASRVSRVL